MATLDQLEIVGIRSFCHESKQTITFDKPLTLILGENGCGKSTIIESLRFVTAQKEPSGKGTFLRDPQHSAQNTIKGNVKLKLYDQRGLEVQLSRAMQVTKTPRGLSTKLLDSTFSRQDPVTKEVKSISSRCMDFTPEALKVFGVSKAIIENVIFCTQEDSMWPLDTDQKLKEKFDQIFDSDRYNKCTKKIKDKRKKLMEDKKKFETELKFLRENKKAASDKRNEKLKLENRVAELTGEIAKLDSDLIPIEKGLKEIYEEEVKLSENHLKREATRTELRGIEKLEKELRSKIRSAACEFLGTNEELDSALKDCDDQAKNSTDLRSELKVAEDREKEISQRIRTTDGKVGELKKVSEMNNEKIIEKDKKISSLANMLGENPNATEEVLQNRIKDKEKDISINREKMETSEENVQRQIDEATKKLYAQEAVVKQKKEALEENQKESKKLKQELEEVEASQAKLDRVATALRKATSELAEHQRIHNVEDLKADVRKFQNELNSTEEKLSDVENKAQILQEQASVIRELELQRDAQNDKESEARRLKNRHEDSLQEIFGNVPDSGFRRAVESHLDMLSRQSRDFQIQQSRKEKEIAALDERRKYLTTSVRDKKAELQRLADNIQEETMGEDWENSVKKQKETVDGLQDAKGTLASSSCMYDRYIKALQRPKPCCPLCHRDFAAEEEARKLAEELSDKMRKVPTMIKDNQRDLDEKQGKLNRLLALKSVNERVAVMTSEIPDAEGELAEIERNLLRGRQELDDIISQKCKVDKNITTCSSIQSDMTLLDQATTEAWKLKIEVQKLEAKLPAGESKQSLREVLALQDKLRHDRKMSRCNLEEAQGKLQKFNEKIQTLQTNKHNLAEEMRSLESGGGSRKALEDRFYDLQGLEAVLMTELQAAQEAVYPLQEERNHIMGSLKILKETNKNKLEAMRNDLAGYKKVIDDISRLQREINNFHTSRTAEKLANLEADLTRLELDAKSVRVKKDSINAKIGDLAKSEVRRRELEDNKNLRQRLAEKSELMKKLEELERNVGNIGYDQLVKRKRKFKSDEERIVQKRANIAGQIGGTEAQIGSLSQELAGKLFAGVDETYKKALVEKVVADSVANDLLRYATCMEWAMGQYHKRQMDRINSFAREYWRTIYQGNDIDYIELLTDECQVTETRRNYTYRLVQVKGEVRMDMRNRCSAGQKMLASLIIRMALAEVFSSNCGILTLDEPTTNLDSKNVRNLARTLSDIVNSKQSAMHTNFQLIVITHDEEFVRELTDIHAVETCIRVWRDMHGKSKTAVRRIHKGSMNRDDGRDR